MKLPLRASLISAAICVVFGGLVLACPRTTQDLGLDIWNYSEEERKLEECQRRFAELESLGECVIQRVTQKSIIVEDVIEGRVTFTQASEQFLALNRIRPSLIPALRIIYQANNDEEASAMQVVGYIRVRAHVDPTVPPETLERVEAELASQYPNHPPHIN